MCLLSNVLSCCLPCRHVMCEEIIIRLPGSHGGAWHRVEVCASGNNYNVHFELWTIRKYMSKLLIPYHWSPWLGDTLLQFENWTKDLFACIAKWKIALEQPHAFCVWSGVDTLGSVVGMDITICYQSCDVYCCWNVTFSINILHVTSSVLSIVFNC